ncbi:polyhydroxyalkanoate synthesis regulator DNA-binding domain-containing protein [Fastidiosibacter lacustris]|uniref:polyhydroxyalkanoate synthesis regulator DNA-binding domain-containing protein n=1 Tax=Fastidiosibacter lacustris TaxID=2056695 RepID=UPI000E347BEE|nr:polyhydroxyalkanoate synthesis regulator DNA-binding domain-containing protein [Fastidiosibacter lacustris]
MGSEKDNIRLIKKYPNRRLYDTKGSCYITAEGVHKLIIEHENVVVVDNKTGKDITRGVLMQIINDLEEKSPRQMFSNEFLAHVIKSYGTEMQNTLVLCFNKTLDLYLSQTNAQEDLIKKSSKQMNPSDYFNTIARENISRWQKSWENLKSTKK